MPYRDPATSRDHMDWDRVRDETTVWTHNRAANAERDHSIEVRRAAAGLGPRSPRRCVKCGAVMHDSAALFCGVCLHLPGAPVITDAPPVRQERP